MVKKITALLLTVVLLLILSSCSGKSETYINSDGTQFLVVRDSDNNIVINDAGKLRVYTLNENGKKQKNDSGDYITEYIDFNGQVVDGKTVETAEMRFTLPENFTADEDNPGYFFNDNYNGQIFISYSRDDIDTNTAEMEANCEKLLESYGSEVFSYEKYTVKISGIECAALKQACVSSEYYKNVYFYYIPYDNGFYAISCMVSTDNAKKVNFDKFAESVILK